MHAVPSDHPQSASPLRSLDAARRERQDRRAGEAALTETAHGQPYVAAADVTALLNRIGECVRALPSFGRTRTQSSAVLAKRTLSAISTCSPSRLAEGDGLRAVLERVNTARDALRGTAPTGAERIAIARWIGQADLAEEDAPADDRDRNGHGLPAHAYVLCGGRVIRQPCDHHGHDDDGAEDGHGSVEERIDDLARAGALIAAEIDRLQQLGERRYA
jgi:hypothetical protein